MRQSENQGNQLYNSPFFSLTHLNGESQNMKLRFDTATCDNDGAIEDILYWLFGWKPICIEDADEGWED
jgi:hypothetical protein